MKILHVIDSGGLYGAEAVLLNLMDEQVRQGLSPSLASIGTLDETEKPLETEARRRGLDVEPFRMRAGPNFPGISRVLAHARERGADLLHSHGYKSNILFGLMPRSLRRLPMVTTVHGFTSTGGVSRMAIYQWLDRASFRRIDRVVLVNAAMKEQKWFRGRDGFDVVNNGIPVEDVGDAPLPGPLQHFVSEGFSVVSAGRLSREKGLDILLDAFAAVAAEHPTLRLVVVGEGPLRQDLESQAERSGLSGQVLFAGYVPGIGRALHRFDLFAMPSRTEGLPIILLEAMAAGVPAVSTRVGGVGEVLDEGRAGWLVEPERADLFATALEEAVEDAAGRAQRREAALARVREHYSSDAMARGYLRIYTEVLER